jgi:hypothetical protein
MPRGPGWCNIGVVIGFLLTSIVAERDLDNDTNITAIYVRPTKGMVHVELSERTEKDTAAVSGEAPRGIGEVANEGPLAHPIMAAAEGEHGAKVVVDKEPAEAGAPQLGPELLSTVSTKEIHSDSGNSKAQRESESVPEVKAQLPTSSLEASVKQAIQALIKSKASNRTATKALGSSMTEVQRSSNASGAASATTSTDEVSEGPEHHHHLKHHAKELMSREEGDAKLEVPEGTVEEVARANMTVNKAASTHEEESDASQASTHEEESDASQEAMLSTSTTEPDERVRVVEQLERDSTSVLSIVFFTYLLLGLAALAACTAYMTYLRGESPADETEKEKWKNVLSYLYASGGPLDPSRPVQASPTAPTADPVQFRSAGESYK